MSKLVTTRILVAGVVLLVLAVVAFSNVDSTVIAQQAVQHYVVPIPSGTEAIQRTLDQAGRESWVLVALEEASRLLKNTRIGLFSWPSCVSRPPPDNGAHGDTLSRRGGQRHPRPAIRDTSPPDSATGPSYRRWRRR